MEELNEILHIPDNIGYWLIRADGGKYYEDFLLNNFIAISDNEITLELIKKVGAESIAGRTVEHYKTLYAEIYKDWTPQQISHGVGRTNKFLDGMQIGDIVLVPSKSSTNFIIGIIQSDPYEERNIISKVEVNYSVNPYHKRRKVVWLKEIRRSEINEKLYWILSAHQTIFDLKEEKDYINQLLSPIYVQNNLLHCNLKIDKADGISADEWYDLYTVIKKGTTNSKDQVFIKSNVQSPGIIEIVTTYLNSPTALAITATLVGMTFTEVRFGDKTVRGIIPYFMNRKLEKEKLKHENRKIEIENLKAEKELELMELDIATKQIENMKKEIEVEQLREQLQISSFNAGKELSIQTQMDSVDDSDEDKSEK